MSHLNPGLISAYNSLTDKHLAGYFSNTRIRRHLQRAGLITRSGRIVPDKEYRHKLIQRAHQRHVRECLAQAIFHKVLEMERVHQIEIKRKLEEFARRERVHKIKVERSKRYEEDIIRILSPRPPTGARGIRKQHSGPEGEHSESSESPGSSRPNTAPGKMQRPVRLKPIHSNSTTASLRRSSPYRVLESSNENDQQFNCTMDMESRRRLTKTEASRGISPYCLPVINNFVTPVPPATKRKERGVKVTPSGTLRGRRLRPTTASSGADVNEDPPMLRSSVHQSRVCVNMMYFGKTVHLSHDLTDMRDEVKVFQQHCGGENLCVFKGKLREGETFQFISRRHRGFPFSLTFFLNGLQVERLSSCCEFKHRKGSRLGGRHGHFGFCSVEGASPCYKCIIAMGLDKRPTPPPKRVKEDSGREESLISPKDAPEMETERTRGDASHSESETSRPQDMETQVKDETAAEEDKVRDDYEEDFEADDEGPAEDAEAKEKKSPSPSGETERPAKERDAPETEDDEKDEDMKSHSGSSSSGSDREESDAEATKDEEEKAEQPEEVNQNETAVPQEIENKDEPNPEEAADTEAEPTVPKNSEVQDSAGDSTEIEVSDNSVPSGNKQSDDASGDKEEEKTVDEDRQEEEPERAKSVQEKLAEAILKESQCSSEPELSDTSTEEEEESAGKGPGQDSKDAVAVKSVTFIEQQQTLVEETKCEEGVGEAEVVQEAPEPTEQEVEAEQDPHEISDGTKDEKIEEEDEKAASEEDKNTAENEKSEDTEETGAALPPVPEEEMTSEHQEDAADKSANGDAAEKENEVKTEAEADTQPDETGQGAKSSEEDESSVSEPNKKTDETALPDNAEAEATTASETMEMKAEPSEEREALDYEEAPVTDTEKGDGEDRDAASKTEVTAENSSSSLEGSGDTTVEKTADVSEENEKDESSKDEIKEDEIKEDEVSAAVEASKDDNQEERGNLGEEQTGKSSVEKEGMLEEKHEEEVKEEEKQSNQEEITEGENREKSEKDDKEETEEEEKNESKAEERIENKENISECTNTEEKANEEQAENAHSEDDKVAIEEIAGESEKTEGDEERERVQNKNVEEEPEDKEAAADKTNEGEKPVEAADEEKDDETEKEEKDQNEGEAEEVATNNDDEGSEEKKVDKPAEGEEISEITGECEKSTDADLDKDDVEISDENIVKSEDSEAANESQETKMAEEAPNSEVEAEDVKKETEGGSEKSTKGEVDGENGEISTGAEKKTHEDEGEAQTEGENDVETAENIEDGRERDKLEEGESTEGKEVIAESEDVSEKHEDDKVDEAPADIDVVQSEAKEGDDSVEKQDEVSKNESEPETSGAEIKEESKSDGRKDDDETKQDENGNISDPDSINRDSDLMKNGENVRSDVSEVMVASSGGQTQTSAPITEESDDKLDESAAPSDSKTDTHPDSAAVDLSAVDGENGADTEEASKASEEGASVLLKPRAQSSPLNDNAEESAAGGKESPEALAREDLVTNWVTMHQTSKFFETFVEPLEELKESQASNSNEEETQATELPRSESPLKMSQSEEQGCTAKDENESGEKNTGIAEKTESNHSEDGEKEALQVQEEAEVKDLSPKSESEHKESVDGHEVRAEEQKGSRGSLDEEKLPESLIQDITEQTDISKAEVESTEGTHHSETSRKPESVNENQTDQKTTDNDPDLSEKQTAVEEVKDLPPSSKTDEHVTSPEALSESNEPKQTEDTFEQSDEPSREVTEITDFTTSKSDAGSHEESEHKDIQPNPSDTGISEDRKDLQLIQDIKHTLSKDRLSTFSVDETLFSRSSYPLLTAAKTESLH